MDRRATTIETLKVEIERLERKFKAHSRSWSAIADRCDDHLSEIGAANERIEYLERELELSREANGALAELVPAEALEFREGGLPWATLPSEPSIVRSMATAAAITVAMAITPWAIASGILLWLAG